VAVDVHIVTPEREVWSGEAEMVVARGVEGEVGILGGHAPLLIELAIGPLTIHLPDGGTHRAVIDGGFMHVTSGDEGGTRVDVLASQAELEGEIDADAARRRAQELRSRLEGGATLPDEEAESEKAELKKALVRLGMVG
jgi:F-type H+-transporting ATPase subunit epsilon